jgi:hypothetical protein
MICKRPGLLRSAMARTHLLQEVRVEILVKDSLLGDTMAWMPTWLDRMGYVPVVFRLTHAQYGAVFRVEFAAAAQAHAFARAFGGRRLAGLGTEALSDGIIDCGMLATDV